jgi:murein DD-endopeptidase MepM/ murein hydrolase activator NlpD
MAEAGQPGRPPSFALPVLCEMGRACFVQNHVDRNPGPEARDYSCGTLTYEGHTGTDFRVRDYVDMERGVAVIAAAPGIVRSVRDGEPDVNMRVIGAEAVKGRESGNFVTIDHGGGWFTVYAHLKRGSVLVRRGQQISTGERLGLVGLSGKTEFPHVHFGVQYGREAVDPFVGRSEWTGCGLGPDPLWSAAALGALEYRSTALLGAGFASTRPSPEAARRGEHRSEKMPRGAELIAFWFDVLGIRQGDTALARVFGPGGNVLGQHSWQPQKSYALWFNFLGRKRAEAEWPPGTYRGEVQIFRTVDGSRKLIAGSGQEIVVE